MEKRDGGGDFYCSNNQLTTLDGAPKEVGGLRNTILARIEDIRNNRGVTIADGILGHVVSKKSGITKIIAVGSKKTLYLVSDGKGNFSHGETIKEARESLVYKITASFDGKIPEKATVSEWIPIYRAITGACSTGVRMFVEKNRMCLSDVKTKEEVLNIIGGAYGSDRFKDVVLKE